MDSGPVVDKVDVGHSLVAAKSHVNASCFRIGEVASVLQQFQANVFDSLAISKNDERLARQFQHDSSITEHIHHFRQNMSNLTAVLLCTPNSADLICWMLPITARLKKSTER